MSTRTTFLTTFTALLALIISFSNMSGQTVFAQQQLNVPQGTAASLNWSGYVTQNKNSTVGDYTSVTGTWVVPTVTAGTSATADATWVGIGGVQTKDLIQAGTQAIVSNGSVSYNAWIETLPGFSQAVPLTVQSGDSITTTLTQQSSGVWNISIVDNTRGTNYTDTVKYNSSLSSAEWVEEMVSNGNGTFRPLDTFGSVNFTNAYATVNGSTGNLTQLGAQPLQMVNGTGATLATASAVGNDNSSFTVTRGSGTATSAVPRTVTGGRWHMVSTATSTAGQAPQQQIPVTIVVHRGRGISYTHSMSIPLGFTFSILRF